MLHSQHPYKLTWAVGGSYVKTINHTGDTINTTHRGRISTYSNRSASRLQRVFNQLDKGKLSNQSAFITLTYPGDYISYLPVIKLHLATFIKALNRLFTDTFFVWRLEYQKRGAPHYHILAFSPPKSSTPLKLYNLKKHISLIWYNIVGSNDIKHLYAGTNIKLVKDWSGISKYVSKYLCKSDANIVESLNIVSPGRFWGIANRKLMPIQIISVYVTRETFYQINRVLRLWIKSKTHRKMTWLRAGSGLTAYLPEPVLERYLAYRVMQLLHDRGYYVPNVSIDKKPDAIITYFENIIAPTLPCV